MVRRILALLVLLAAPVAAHADESLMDQTHWALEVKGGYFHPDIDNWKAYYGDDKMPAYGASLAYRLFRQLDLGVEAGYGRDRGQGDAPLNSALQGQPVTAGSVKYQVAPLNLFVLYRARYSDNQWFVPYAGGGYTRMFYRESVAAQGAVRGAVNGYHTRVGIQLLLDDLDTSAANGLYLDYGVFHTYLFVELETTHAMLGTPSVNLGGKSWMAGFLFEF